MLMIVTIENKVITRARGESRGHGVEMGHGQVAAVEGFEKDLSVEVVGIKTEPALSENDLHHCSQKRYGSAGGSLFPKRA